MRLWKNCISLLCVAGLIAGCNALREQAPGTLIVREARVFAAAEGPRLEVNLDAA